MGQAPNGTYVNGVRVDDLTATVEFTSLNGMVSATLTYTQVVALRAELADMQRDMLMSAEMQRDLASHH